MRLKHINLIDILTFGGLAMVATVASIVFACFQDSWDAGKVIALTVVPLGFIVVAVIVFWRQYNSKPDWIARQGTMVWMEDSIQKNLINNPPIRDLLDDYLDCFAKHLPILAKKWLDVDILEQEVLDVLSKVKLQWTEKKISRIGIGWSVKDKEGIQQGYNIVVHWNRRTFTNTALTHELLHVMRQKLMSKDIDYEHKDIGWWNQESAINNRIASEIFGT